ncbi:zincin-like metallopeptidase domain-containing protein, partial [Enterobacter hormaechei]|uniref:zincin-like metallopeptidase domain-containing protein n=1 Tax=Enterobacter hormaechei TaxID=158836 RepID=UPI00312CAA56
MTEPPTPLFERIEQADTFIKATGARIKHDGGDRAFYNRLSDDIHLPVPDVFKGSKTQTAQESYYATTLHELTHLSGHPKRLDRQFGKRFGDQDYAFEELVAEMGSAFLCAKLE